MEETENVELKIKNIIEKIKPFLISDGGNIEFIKYENNVVYVKLSIKNIDYRINKKRKNQIVEVGSGFECLEKNLNMWIKEKEVSKKNIEKMQKN